MRFGLNCPGSRDRWKLVPLSEKLDWEGRKRCQKMSTFRLAIDDTREVLGQRRDNELGYCIRLDLVLRLMVGIEQESTQNLHDPPTLPQASSCKAVPPHSQQPGSPIPSDRELPELESSIRDGGRNISGLSPGSKPPNPRTLPNRCHPSTNGNVQILRRSSRARNRYKS